MDVASSLPVSLSFLPPEDRVTVRAVAAMVAEAGGRARVVGGCVRDALMGLTAKDIDIEVFGLEAAELERLLRRKFSLVTVGRAFGVFKVRGHEIDISLPRRESKSGTGHKGFTVEGDPHLSVQEAARRRDFTLNAIAFDPLTGELIDPLGGRADMEAGVLRHCSDAFAEDPLRVLRAMQFLARFELASAPETLELCRGIEPEELPPERQFEEWKKLLLQGARPSRGLAFLRASGWVRYYPELEALIGCPQDPQWHPEGDVWTHTLHCLDAFARARLGEPFEDLVIALAVLCHDLGKVLTTATDADGRIRSPGHEKAGVEVARRLLGRLTAHRELTEAVLVLVETHMRPGQLYDARASDSAVRRLARKVGRIDRLVRVCEADAAGRPPLPADFPAGPWLLERARALEVSEAAPEPILKGRHLIARGMKPGPCFAEILEACYEAQLDGVFSSEEEGMAFLDTFLAGREG